MERTSVSPILSHYSGSNPGPGDKGKAPLVEDNDEDEEEVLLQRKRRASAPLAPNVNPESAPGEGTVFFMGQFYLVFGGGP